MTIGLAATLLATLGLWWAGARQAKGRSRAWLPAVPPVLLALGGVALVHPAWVAPLPPWPVPSRSARRGLPEPAQGRPVFAYFTADCAPPARSTKGRIETAAVEQALADGKVAVLAGDWTNGDATPAASSEAHNRGGGAALPCASRAGRPEVAPKQSRICCEWCWAAVRLNLTVSTVISAEAGIHWPSAAERAEPSWQMDPRLRGDDGVCGMRPSLILAS